MRVITAGRYGLVLVAAGVAVWLWLAEPMGSLSLAGQRTLGAFVLCLSLWASNVIPLAATGLLAVVLLPVLGVVPASRAFGYFGNQAVFFILGVFLLAAAMIDTGLSRRLTLKLLQRFDRRPGLLVAGVVVSTSLLALVMPEHAVAAMMLPILLEVAGALQLPRGRSAYAQMLFLGMAWGCIIGGVGTVLGGARAPLALGLLGDSYDGRYQISFVQWMVAALPVTAILTVVALVMLRLRLRSEVVDIGRATAMLDGQVRSLGPMSWRERRLAGLGLLTVASWVVLGSRMNLAVISVLGAVGLFVLGISQWRRLQDYVNWGVIVMYGGAVAMGLALDETGALGPIVQAVVPAGLPSFAGLAGVGVLTIILTEGISNAAAVAIMLPAGFSLCETLGIAPVTMTLTVAVPAGLAFCLPISSPPNAIAYSGGYIRIRQMVRMGVAMNVVALAVFLAVARFYWPLIGVGL